MLQTRCLARLVAQYFFLSASVNRSALARRDRVLARRSFPMPTNQRKIQSTGTYDWLINSHFYHAALAQVRLLFKHDQLENRCKSKAKKTEGKTHVSPETKTGSSQ